MGSKIGKIILKCIYFSILIGVVVFFYIVIKKDFLDKGFGIIEDNIQLDYGDTYTINSDKNNEDTTWTSSDPDLVSVDENGNLSVHGNRDGEVTITVTDKDGKKTDTVKVDVSKVETVIEPTGLKLDKNEIVLKYRQEAQIKAEISPKDVTNKIINWTSSNNNLVKVDSLGNIKAVGNKDGEVLIQATTANGEFSATVKVTVKFVDQSVKVSGIKLSDDSITLKYGESKKIKATVSPSDATNKKVIWKSSNPDLVDVDSSGNVLTKNNKGGSATITATTDDGGFTAKVKVTVKAVNKTIKVSGIKLNKTSTTLKYGKTESLVATISPSNATNKGVTWTSSDTKLVTVDSGGKIKAVGNKDGSATITATTVDGGLIAKVKVKVTSIKVTGIKLDKSSLSLKYGQSSNIVATVSPSNAANKKVIWSSSNTSLVTVDASGKVTVVGNKNGSATITAKTEDGSFTANVVIKTLCIKVSGIKLDKSSLTLNYGQSNTLVATVSPSNAANKKVSWSSSNSNLVSVSSSGVVSAVGNKNGSAIITVKTSDGGFTATAKVTVKKVENVLETHFLNTQNLVKDYGGNESIILKSIKGNIILVDTGNNDNDIYNKIVNTLKKLSGNSTPVIDYLIISHSHGDHGGNLNKILRNQDIVIRNIIYKDEKWGSKYSSKTIGQLISAAKSEVSARKNMNVINTTTLSGNNVTYNLTNEDSVKLRIFNLNDVFKNTDCSNKEVYIVKFRASTTNALKYNNKYIYLNSLEPGASMLQFSSEAIIEDSSKKPAKRFYAYTDKRTSLCHANANSIAVLVEAKTNVGSKYVYIPSDLENNGYSVFGNYSQSGLNQGFKYGTIYGNGTTYYFENNYGKTNSLNNSWTIKDNQFITGISPVKMASETRVANVIRKTIGESNLNNIVIYQQSHHGYNNAKDAVDTLNLNRTGVYAIATNSHTGVSSNDALLARSYYYTLSNTKKMASGHYKYDGIYCYIKSDGSYSCSYVEK